MISIKFANKEDIPDILKLEEKNELLISRKSLEEDFSSDYIYFLAYEGKLLIGFIGAIKAYDHVEIIDILVDKHNRSKKVGTLLLATLINYIKLENLSKYAFKCSINNTDRTNIITNHDVLLSSILLEVRESNNIAISLYLAFNFKKLSIRKNYYSNPIESALILQLEL